MKFVKKLTCLFLAIVMTMAMGITAFAAESAGDTSSTTKMVTLSIKDPVEGHTYKVYQILTGDVSNLSGGEGTLSNVKVGSSVKTDNTDTAAQIVEKLKALEDGALGNAAYAYIDTSKEVATLSTTSKTASVVPGYYVIVDASYSGTATENVTYSRNLVAVVGNTEVTPKTETPEIDKNIINENEPNKALDYKKDAESGKVTGKADTAAIGDIIQYEITGKVPNYEGYTYYYYILNDTLSEGLTLNDANDAGFTITVGGTTLTRGSDYYIYKEGQTFKVAFANIKSYTVGAAISVKYSATVNEKAVIGTNPNTNDVYLQYSNNPNESEKKDKENVPGTPESDDVTGKTPTYETKTYVAEINLTKVDQDGMPLKGAEFTLTGTNLNEVIIRTDYTFAAATGDQVGTYYKLNDGTYTETAPTADTKDADGNVTKTGTYSKYDGVTQGEDGKLTGPSTMYVRTTTVKTETTAAKDSKVTATVNDNGYVTFTGLNKGEYTLSETKTPEGYNTIADITFTIGASETGHEDGELVGGGISWTSNNSKVIVKNGTFYVTIENKKGDLLPSTGGMGTTVIYIAGIAMVVAAGVVTIVRKRMV